MNKNTRSVQAKRIAAPQVRLEPVQNSHTPPPRSTGDARTEPPQKNVRRDITMLDELGEIMLGMLTLHGYTTPRRS